MLAGEACRPSPRARCRRCARCRARARPARPGSASPTRPPRACAPWRGARRRARATRDRCRRRCASPKMRSPIAANSSSVRPRTIARLSETKAEKFLRAELEGRGRGEPRRATSAGADAAAGKPFAHEGAGGEARRSACGRGRRTRRSAGPPGPRRSRGSGCRDVTSSASGPRTIAHDRRRVALPPAAALQGPPVSPSPIVRHPGRTARVRVTTSAGDADRRPRVRRGCRRAGLAGGGRARRLPARCLQRARAAACSRTGSSATARGRRRRRDARSCRSRRRGGARAGAAGPGASRVGDRGRRRSADGAAARRLVRRARRRACATSALLDILTADGPARSRAAAPALDPARAIPSAAASSPASRRRSRSCASAGASAAAQDETETTGLAEFVARQAALALERAERRLRGARYKVPRFVREDILARPGVPRRHRAARARARQARGRRSPRRPRATCARSPPRTAPTSSTSSRG